jgi:hypothetical protein
MMISCKRFSIYHQKKKGKPWWLPRPRSLKRVLAVHFNEVPALMEEEEVRKPLIEEDDSLPPILP